MRALHTADWHIGQTLNGWSREAEHEVFLNALAELLETEEIDLLLVAGDVFDTTNPSGESQRLFYRALAGFKQRRPNLTVVISGGNHDPALRLEAPGDLIEAFDIHTIGTVRRRNGAVDVDAHLVPVPGLDGEPAAFVLAIPFLRAADLTGISFSADDQDLSIIEAARRFHAELTDAAAAKVGALPLIATGHLHCAGGLESEGAERRILIGGAHAVPPDIFPERLDYVALGHLHGPQGLAGGRVRYSGSCFPLSASEIRYRHGATILDIDGRTITATHREIPWPAPVLRLPETGITDLAGLEDALAGIETDAPEDLRPLVYVELVAEDAPTVVLGKAEALLREAPVRTAGVRIHRPEAKAEAGATPPAVPLSDTDPETLFSAAFETQNGFAPEARHLAAFRDAVGEV
ncbi:MAG: exonuclease SbcCD subunit D [Maritimibacter sp.]|uniref:exonuclease SbcCD subunit D n=1 Tax=Maritimibacter sp. TaxID=2003363 RepID=UPI001E111DFF|nr:exonuclease SbcCD subunit D [Maritimibacter sp.]MBL6427750.1 exonuclease SbcCD subunit D [Maritimibacter sp.]